MRITVRFFAIALLITICGTTAAAQNGDRLDADYPKKGEGIYALLKRNGIKPTSTAVSEFRQLNTNKFIGDNGLRKNVAYNLPAGETANIYPIFGSKYEKLTIRSDRLEGCVYYIVSGHGGPDPGAIGKRGGRSLNEDEYAYDISLRLARRLLEESATVYLLVRDDDGIRDGEWLRHDRDEVNLGGRRIDNDQLDRLQERVSKINSLFDKHRSSARLQRVVEIHVDSAPSTRTKIDVHFYYGSRSGKRLSNILRDTFEAQYARNQPGRGYEGSVSKRNLYMLVNTKPVASYVELGNIRNSGDQVRLMKSDNRQALANWMALGLLEEVRAVKRW